MYPTKCILCGHDAERNVFTEAKPDKHGRVNVASGEKYDCPECGRYALDNYEHNFVQYRAAEEQKKVLSKYVKTHPDEACKFKVLRWEEIKKILKLP